MTMQVQTGVRTAEREHARGVAAVPIDRVHLGRYTMGNRALELEVLQLFVGQAPLTLSDLRRADSAKAWHMAAHTLKGSARAVGAWDLAQIAAEAETAGFPAATRETVLTRLERSLSEVADYIDGLAGPA